MADTAKKESPKEADWHPRDPLGLALVGLILGVAAERGFNGQPLGISFPVWLGLMSLALWGWSRREGRLPALGASVLLPLPALTGALVVLRSEPMTTFLAVSSAFTLFVVLIRVYRPGGLLRWGWLDYLVAGLWVPLEGWLRPWWTLNETQRWLTREQQGAKRALAVLRGLLLALPILIVFTALLSAADLVFQELVEEALAWLNLERIFEWLGRITFALLAAVFAIGLLETALRRGRQEARVRDGQPLLKPFVGIVETTVVLASIDLIFAIFVGVQFRYFFGGEANIHAAGFTYSEYARRGFGELVLVSALTLGLILALAAWGRREDGRSRHVFNVFSGLMVALTAVMLLSAFGRLTLYEQAYGFTRLRTYTHVAILWLAALFAAFLGLLFSRHLHRFPAAALVGALGFTVTMAGLNVDGFIVARNFEHLEAIGRLDGYYLARLSSDSVPALVEHLEAAPAEERPILLAGLSCHQLRLDRRAEQAGWPSFRWSHRRAEAALAAIAGELAEHPAEVVNDAYAEVDLGEDESFYCYPFDL